MSVASEFGKLPVAAKVAVAGGLLLLITRKALKGLDYDSDSVADLHPAMRDKALEWQRRMEARGRKVKFTQTRRSLGRQAALMAGGQSWTDLGYHQPGLAFDFVVWSPEYRRWAFPQSSDDAATSAALHALLDEGGKVGEEMGLAWGGRWSTPDKFHLQYKESGLTAAKAYTRMIAEGPAFRLGNWASTVAGMGNYVPAGSNT